MHDNWQHLAQQASTEMDSTKLMAIVTELNRVLGENEQAAREMHRQQFNEPWPYRLGLGFRGY